MRFLVVGAGVIGSVYAGHLLRAGHQVTLVERGQRLADLQSEGLVLEDAASGRRSVQPIPVIERPDRADRYDVVLVPVRSEQLEDTLPVLTALDDGSDVVFFGNTAGHQELLTAALGERALFGFPAVGGSRHGSAIRYVLIAQQQTMLGESTGTLTPRVVQLRTVLRGAGFPTRVTRHIDKWLLGHAAFIVPIGCALRGVGTDPVRLAANPQRIRLMVRATSQAFAALQSSGQVEIPANLRLLYRLTTPAIVRYWQRIFAGPQGELWFAAHTRAAPEEISALTTELSAAIRQSQRLTPDLDQLLATPPTLSV